MATSKRKNLLPNNKITDAFLDQTGIVLNDPITGRDITPFGPRRSDSPSTGSTNKNDSKTASNESVGNTIEYNRDADTGKLTGIKLPGKSRILGLSPKEVRDLAAKYSAASSLDAGSGGGGGVLDSEAIAQAELQRRNAIEAIKGLGPGVYDPTRPDLMPGGMDTQDNLFGLGGVFNPQVQVLKEILKDRFAKSGEQRKAGLFDYMTPEEIRSEARKSINEDINKKFFTDSERFAAFLEAIPIGNSKIRQYATSLTLPGEEISQIESRIGEQEKRVTFIRERVSAGDKDPYEAIVEINQINDELVEMQSRLSRLINVSADLRANPQNIHKIEDKLLYVKSKVKLTSDTAAARAINPEGDMQMYKVLEELNYGNYGKGSGNY